jgi:hypothetical protein
MIEQPGDFGDVAKWREKEFLEYVHTTTGKVRLFLLLRDIWAWLSRKIWILMLEMQYISF